MEPIYINKDGWIDPSCPHCNAIMRLNYNRWRKDGKFVDDPPNLRMYCLSCHYAVEVYPAMLDADNIDQSTDTTFKCYNGPVKYVEVA